ncbi:BMP family ABC transporter substrate-binding protein [Clostridium bowmanii]|uniref:BMP family lipoprotein n=1 Tax=Clostridium bowmanii TaxID=132925 RepID=UPI001C0CF4FE|nr:BMP family ABC transporter substrate-binding protein [Clostridium bowmanii]MBU3191078.1 BMP family ABC transporter substrate-binding protein [Clostridium bowmanii]MCA1075488.1 BMP family ABC transporter substrate-binding protein [Clostridium bowmanii]
MNKKKVVAILTVVAVVATLFVGCGTKKVEETKTTTAKTTEAAKAPMTIGLSTDEGGLNDKSFNQSANEGVNKAKGEDGFTYNAIESKKKEDYTANLEALIENGSNLTFAIGFQMADAMTEVAKNHTDKNFAIIDSEVKLPNVVSIMFKEQEGSFLMGVIAGKMTKTNKIGFIGGKDFALINKFEAGFAAGVKSVNPEAAKGLLSADGKTPGTTVKYADSFDDSAKGYELAKSLYQGGCDVVYHAAGGVGIGLFKAAKELKDSGKAVWAIGVDMDQSLTVPEYADVILSSMIKRVDTATYNESKAQVKNEFKGNTTINLGLKEEGVGIAETSSKNVPADILTLVKTYQDKVIAGEIVVPADRKGAMDFKVK